MDLNVKIIRQRKAASASDKDASLFLQLAILKGCEASLLNICLRFAGVVCVCYCIRYYLQCKCEEKKRAHSSKSDSFCWIVQWEWKMLGKICKWEKRSHTINVEPNAENRWQNHKGKWLVIIWLVRFVVGWQCNCFRLMFRTKCTECS